jgi:hypothetical protein
MAEWDRRTVWRQGRILAPDSLVPLGLVPGADTARSIVVVVSHDCDLAQTRTPSRWLK